MTVTTLHHIMILQTSWLQVSSVSRRLQKASCYTCANGLCQSPGIIIKQSWPDIALMSPFLGKYGAT